KPTSTTQSIIDMNGTATITLSSGTVQANSFTSPTIYVDGVVSSTFPDTGWHLVTVTTGTAINATALNVGRVSSTYYAGALDGVRLYTRALSAQEVADLYNLGAAKFQASQNAVLTTGLVGLWSMDGADVDWSASTTEIKDRSGNANHGDAINLAGPANAVLGKLGQALDFDGTNDYVNIADPADGSLDFGANQDFTVSAWVKTTQGQVAGQYPSILRKGIYGPRFGYDLFVHSSNDPPPNGPKWKLEIWNNGSGSLVIGANDITDGVWHHVVGLRQGSTLYAYEDGVLANSAAAITTTLAHTNPLTIGSDNSPGHFIDGAIDDVRVYNRALSAQEVADLYNAGR
ncbi:MAG: LamG-like jellyroll fold domain-containing protein, partial [Gammaproteobacteria bacterium]